MISEEEGVCGGEITTEKKMFESYDQKKNKKNENEKIFVSKQIPLKYIDNLGEPSARLTCSIQIYCEAFF